MAHNIKQYDQQEGVEVAWHQKTIVRPEITLDDNWLRRWDVQPVLLDKRGLQTKYAVLEVSDVPGLEVGKAYDTETFAPITNAQFLDLVRSSIAGTDHRIVSVGSYRNRGRVSLSLELKGKEKFESAGRKFSAFLNFGNGHDKSSVLWVNTSNTCTVCDNTFSLNLLSIERRQSERSNDISTAIRHTPNAVLKLPALANLIDRAVGVQAEFAAALDFAAQQRVTKTDARILFAGFVGRDLPKEATELTTFAEKRVSRLVDLFEAGRGNRGENLADAFSAVTDYFTHESVRGGDIQRQILASELESGLRAKRTFWDIVRSPEALEATQKRGAELVTV